MVQDEEGIGRKNKPKYSWCNRNHKTSVLSHNIREYGYAYGAVEPIAGENFFLILSYCKTDCMNVFLKEMSKKYKDDVMLLVCDGTRWHKSKGLQTPENIIITHIPPYTQKMNPIEQIWKQIRSMGFKLIHKIIYRPLCLA